MGTSTSSKGPTSSISMDPPWLDDINSDPTTSIDSDSNSDEDFNTHTK